MPKIEKSNTKKKNATIDTRLALLAVFLLIIGYGIYTQTAPTIRYNVYIDSSHVGGLTRKEADAVLQKKIRYLTDLRIALHIESAYYPITADVIDMRYDTERAAQTAWEVGRTGNVLLRVVRLAS